MKKLLLLFAVCFPMGLLALEPVTFAPDTTIRIDGKRIDIVDGEERLKVRVYEKNQNGDFEEDELVFEGHYKDGRSYEKRKYGKSITIPLPSWNNGFDPHWAGVGLGFANFADGDLHVNDVDGVYLNSGKSWELNINFFEHHFRLSRRYGWAVVTGAGIRWDRYRLDGNECFAKEDGRTILRPAPEGIRYSASRLKTTSLTIPLLIEWQNLKRKDSDFFVSAGIVMVVKTASSSKIVYRDENGKKRKDKVGEGLYIRPVNMDLLFQMGYDWIGLFAKYSPFEMFEKDRGPAIHPVSLGLQLHF